MEENDFDIIKKANIIRAVPHPSSLSGVPEGQYTLTPSMVGSISQADLEKLAQTKWGDERTRQGIEFMKSVITDAVDFAVAGYHVDLGILRMSCSISGTVPRERMGHNAQAGEAAIKLLIAPGAALQERIDKTGIFVEDHIGSDAPVLQIVRDAVSKTADTLYIGRMAEIRGLNIAVRGDQTGVVGVHYACQ